MWPIVHILLSLIIIIIINPQAGIQKATKRFIINIICLPAYKSRELKQKAKNTILFVK